MNKIGNSAVTSYVKDELVACRACLAAETGAELHNLHDNDLAEVFADLSGFPVEATDGYPQLICSMCLHMVCKLLLFRSRCQSAMDILQQMVADDVEITTESLVKLEHTLNHSLMKSEVIIMNSDDTTPSVTDESDDDDVQLEVTDDDCKDIVSVKDNHNVDDNENLKSEFLLTAVTEETSDNSKKGIKQDSLESTVFDKHYHEDLSNSDYLKWPDDIKILTCTGAANEGYKAHTSKAKVELPSSAYQTKSHSPVSYQSSTHITFKEISSNFLHKSFAKRHLKLHKSEKLFSCDTCYKNFKAKGDLCRHKKIHTGERPYICDVCAKNFVFKFELVRHLSTHSTEKPYSCDECQKTFSHKALLGRHKKIHTGVKPHSCNLCHMSFVFKCQLIRHRKIHTGEKPHPCDVCDKKFSERKTLDLHKRTHTGEKPFSCDICDKAFSRKYNLRIHLNTHSQNRRFAPENDGT